MLSSSSTSCCYWLCSSSSGRQCCGYLLWSCGAGTTRDTDISTPIKLLLGSEPNSFFTSVWILTPTIACNKRTRWYPDEGTVSAAGPSGNLTLNTESKSLESTWATSDLKSLTIFISGRGGGAMGEAMGSGGSGGLWGGGSLELIYAGVFWRFWAKISTTAESCCTTDSLLAETNKCHSKKGVWACFFRIFFPNVVKSPEALLDYLKEKWYESIVETLKETQ